MTNLELYRKFENQLLEHRIGHGVGTPLEYSIIDNMEKAWYALSPEEQLLLNTEPQHCLLSETAKSYKDCTERILEIQKQSPNDSTPEEESLLDKMDILWHNISDKEKAWLSRSL